MADNVSMLNRGGWWPLAAVAAVLGTITAAGAGVAGIALWAADKQVVPGVAGAVVFATVLVYIWKYHRKKGGWKLWAHVAAGVLMTVALGVISAALN